MEYRVLGPVDVSDGGRAVPVSGPRQRGVLAALALKTGQVLPVRRLVEAVWEGAPPATAHRQILTAVSVLRRRLGSAIATVPGGYRLRAEPHDVDLHVFETRVRQARRLTGDGRLETGVLAMREALALWRGPALGGVRGLTAEIARLEEQRVNVLEDCLDAELALGSHTERVAELSELVAAHPYRERLRALLMVALCRRGRQAEALDVYWTGRGLLVESLGIEPGQHLRDLYESIVSGAHQAVYLSSQGSLPMQNSQ
jgi:DNA-binding SARP family transcriptional activator